MNEQRLPLKDIRRLANALDAWVRIPGTKFTIGLDALLGLVPGLGDASGALFGGWILLQAARAGVPTVVLARMLGNLLIDALAGSIPILGDLFDVSWRANLRNVKLLEAHLAQPARTKSVPVRKSFASAVALLLTAIVAAAVLGEVLLAWLLVEMFR